MVQLGLAVGPRSLHAERTRAESQFYSVVGAGGNGGLLAQAINKYYFSGDQARQAMDPAFLIERVVPFFVDTAWPAPYEQHLEQWIDYANDLANRSEANGAARWGSAWQAPQRARAHGGPKARRGGGNR